jgi:hypothetical protein
MGLEFQEQRDSQDDRQPEATERREVPKNKDAAGKNPNTPYETMPEAPNIKRRILCTRPFTVYKDIIDAYGKGAGKKMDAPALYTICSDKVVIEKRMLQVGDEDGNELGWINAEEANAQEWNIPNVYIPSDFREVKKLECFSDPRDVQSITIDVDSSSIFPILEVKEINGVDWYRVAPSLSQSGKGMKEPLWVRDRNTQDQRIADTDKFIVTKRTAQAFARNMKRITEQMRLFDSSDRKGNAMENTLKALQMLYLQTMGASSNISQLSDDTKRQSTIDFFKKSPALAHIPDFLHLTLDDFARMDTQAFDQEVNQLQ